MATHVPGILSGDLANVINSSKVLVVGAGGIGCELLKNLVLTGFEDIELIDLDTIDVSNLNRQFLFHKEHVGRSKSEVAKESALRFNSKAKIVSYHDSIMGPDYGVTFYKKFDIVMNALDNRAARNHVNRMCLAANIPLVESGTAGYLGQVTVIKKGLTECYECQPKPTQKTFPGCTIRNTPSEPIHCIVWAKHLFNQLFGEADPDEDVSPDAADPEQVGDAGKTALGAEANDDGNVNRISTRAWAVSHDYDPQRLFRKLFHDDIKYLLSMDKLWVKRRPPTPLVWRRLETEFLAAAHGVVPLTSRVSTTKCNPWWNPACTKALQVKRARWKSYRRKRHTNSSEHHHILFKQASSQFSRIIKDAKAESVRRIRENAAKEAGDINGEGLISDQRQWNILDCRDALEKSTRNLRDRMKQLGENDHLVWDKDDADCLDFVTAYANFRAYIFNITMKTRFDVKSMAGNIIPAIATTNAIIAGLIVLEGMKILQGNTEQCKTVYLNRRPNPKKRLLVPCVLDKPNPKCYVCSEKPEVCVRLNVETITIHTLQEKILKNALNMVAPDVELADGKGTIIISSEPGETDSNNDKFLKDFNIRDGTQLNCDDFLQNYTLVVTILQCEKLEDGVEFEVIGDKDQLKAKEEEEAVANNINEDGAGSSLSATTIAKVDDEDDLICLDDMPKKRKAEEEGEQPSKKRHVSLDNDDVIVL